MAGVTGAGWNGPGARRIGCGHFAREWAEHSGLARAEPPAPEREATWIEKPAGYNRSGLRIQAIRIRNSVVRQHVICERTMKPCLSMPTSVPMQTGERPVAHGPAACSLSPGYGKPRLTRVRCERGSGLSLVTQPPTRGHGTESSTPKRHRRESAKSHRAATPWIEARRTQARDLRLTMIPHSNKNDSHYEYNDGIPDTVGLVELR